MSFANGFPLLYQADTEGFGTPIPVGAIKGQGLTISAAATVWDGQIVNLYTCDHYTLDTTKYVPLCDYSGATVSFGGSGSFTLPIIQPGTYVIAELATIGGSSTPVNVFIG